MIIGITGTDGAGKGVVVEYLTTTKGFTHYSARALIVEKIKRRGLPVNRDNMRLVANDLRREQGNDYLVKTYLARANQENVKNAVIESLRATAEAETLHSAGGILLAVDADQRMRYERIKARASETDLISFEKFCKQEAIEMNDPDPNGMQKAAVMEMADYKVENNGTLEELYAQIDDVLRQIENAN